jgi:hypothetical protein
MAEPSLLRRAARAGTVLAVALAVPAPAVPARVRVYQ